MKRIAALTHLAQTPSSRFRVRSLIPGLLERGVEVTDMPRRYNTEMSAATFPDTRISRDPRKAALAAGYHAGDIGHSLSRVLRTRRYDGTWVSREIVIGHRSWEGLVGQPLYYDIDDAVFLRARALRTGIDALIRRATCVFAGNGFLADYCAQFCDTVHVVPTAVDTGRFRPAPSWRPEGPFTMLWSGTSSSFPYLEAIEPVLHAFLSTKPDARFRVCSNRYPEELTRLHEYIDYLPWSPEDEVAQMQDADIGLMPIPDTDWARGKCSYKMLLYAACGVPCVVSAVGMNNDVLEKGAVGVGCASPAEWRDALEDAYSERDRLRTIFPDGPDVVRQHYSTESVCDRIAGVMRA